MVHNYTLSDTKIDSVESYKDSGILFDNCLKFHQHTTSRSVAAKANRMLGLIKKSFESLDPGMLARLFKTLVRPIIEYGKITYMRTSFYSRSKEIREHPK